MAVIPHAIYLPSDLLEALAERTGHFWSAPQNEDVVADAVRAWLQPAPAASAASAAPPQAPAARPDAGYQWKQLFLPDGTKLRASFGRQPWFAEVEGAEIIYGEHAISPSRFANLRGSGNRNAWKAVWLRFPGSDEWLLADVCRAARIVAIARMFGDDAREAGQLIRPARGQRRRKGKGKGKRKSLRRARAGAAPQQPAARLSPPQPKEAGTSGPAAADYRNGAPSKNGSRRDDRRKRRATKHAPEDRKDR